VKRQMVAEMITDHGLSERRACGLMEITRRSFRREPAPDRNQELRERLRALAEERRRWVVRCCTACCAGKAGGSITSGWSASIASKGYRYAGAADASD